MSSLEAEASSMSFESAMERLEQIVAQIESSKLPLEDLIVRYEEGIRLVAVCNERLAAAENRIEVLNRNTSAKGQLTQTDRSKDSVKVQNDEINLF